MDKGNNNLMTKLECKSCGDELNICHIDELLLPWKCEKCGKKMVYKKDDIFVIKKKREIQNGND